MTSTYDAAPSLPAETLQHIAQYLHTSNEMHAFVTALPITWLTSPMAALHELYACVRDGRLVDTSAEEPAMAHFWPEVQLPRSFTDAPLPRSEADAQLVTLLRAYLPMVPRLALCISVHSHIVRAVSDFIPLGTKLHVKDVCSPADLVRATALGHLASARVFINDNDEDDEVYMDDANDGDEWLLDSFDPMRWTPSLQELYVGWDSGISARLQAAFIQTIAASRITHLALHYMYDDSDAKWSDETVLVFGRWLMSQPVVSLELGRLPLHDHDMAKVSLTVLLSKTLKSLQIEGKGLASKLLDIIVRQPYRRVPNIGRVALPAQLETFEAYLDRQRDAAAFVRCLRSTNLRRVVLHCDKPLDDVTALAMRTELAALPALRFLKLGGRNMPIVTAQQMQRLETVQLYLGYFGDAVALPMVRALPQCQWLRHLSFTNQACTHLTAEALAAAIPHCPSLKHLDLSSNEVGFEGLLALLPIVQCLDVLILRGNGIHNGGAHALSWDMNATAHLLELNLAGNPIAEDGILCLLHAMATSPVERRGVLDLRNTIKDNAARANCLRFAREKLPIPAWCMLDSVR